MRILEGEHYGKTALVEKRMLKEEKKNAGTGKAKKENRKENRI